MNDRCVAGIPFNCTSFRKQSDFMAHLKPFYHSAEQR